LSVEAWRIVKAKHASTAFSGEGSWRYGGRWNSPGTCVVYVASSASLALLEILVHLDSARPLSSYVLIRLRFDPSLVADAPEIPLKWRANPPGPASQAIGDSWARSASSVAMILPSVIVPHEPIYLLNPEHPGFSQVEIGPAQPFPIDERLVD
jgi:RES domain-containing protein